MLRENYKGLKQNNDFSVKYDKFLVNDPQGQRN